MINFVLTATLPRVVKLIFFSYLLLIHVENPPENVCFLSKRDTTCPKSTLQEHNVVLLKDREKVHHQGNVVFKELLHEFPLFNLMSYVTTKRSIAKSIVFTYYSKTQRSILEDEV